MYAILQTPDDARQRLQDAKDLKLFSEKIADEIAAIVNGAKEEVF